jgi:hypothetical protein
MIDEREVLAALRRAADHAGTVGATARMVADEMDFTSVGEVAHELARLERGTLLGSEVSPIGSRWYSEPDTPEQDRAAEAEWDTLIGS